MITGNGGMFQQIFYAVTDDATEKITSIEVPTSIVNSTETVIITIYNDSALFQIAKPAEQTNFTYFPDTAVLGFAVGNGRNYSNLIIPVRIILQSISVQRNEVCKVVASLIIHVHTILIYSRPFLFSKEFFLIEFS